MEALLVGFLALYLIIVSLSIAEDCCKICSRILKKSNLFFIEYREIIIALFIASLICLIMWNPCKELTEVTQLNSLGLNLFAGIVGAAFTIFVLDTLAKKREEKVKFPKTLAAYREIRIPFARLLNFWVLAYDMCSPKSRPESAYDFLTIKYFKEINSRLNLNGKVHTDVIVFDSPSWTNHVTHTYSQFVLKLEKTLERHPDLDPYIYEQIHTLVNCFTTEHFCSFGGFRQKLINTKKIGDLSVLDYTPIKCAKAELTLIANILKWLEDFHSTHSKEASYNLNFPYSYSIKRKIKSPESRISDEKFIENAKILSQMNKITAKHNRDTAAG